MRILVTDGMDASAVEKLRGDGYEVVEQFLRQIVDYPDETVLWLRGRTEEHL